MATSKFVGHDEGTVKPPNPPVGYNSPATHAPLATTADSVNVKTPMGNTGKSS